MTKTSKKKIYTFSGLLFIVILVFLSSDKINSSSDEHKYTFIPARIPARIDTVVANFTHFFETQMDSSGIPGAALTIVDKNSIICTETYGVKEVNTNDYIDDNTVFCLASVSKGFASFLSALLVDENKINWNDPVQKYIPELQLQDTVATKNLTIKHVLNHTSGLIPHAYDDRIEDGVPFEEIIPKLQTVDICCPTGQVYGYQNVVYSLISPIIEHATGNSYVNLMNQKVFQPLSMHNASLGYNGLVSSGNYAKPHLRYNGKWKRVPVNKTYYSVLPAAGVNASICDMSMWLITLLNGYPEIISSEILNQLFEPTVETPLKWNYLRYWDNLENKSYGLGWRIYKYSGKKIVYHGGYIRGYRSEIAFCPDEGIGLAILMNSNNRLAGQVIPTFFRLYFDQYQENKSFANLNK